MKKSKTILIHKYQYRRARTLIRVAAYRRLRPVYVSKVIRVEKSHQIFRSIETNKSGLFRRSRQRLKIVRKTPAGVYSADLTIAIINHRGKKLKPIHIKGIGLSKNKREWAGQLSFYTNTQLGAFSLYMARYARRFKKSGFKQARSVKISMEITERSKRAAKICVKKKR